jgi:hypothetical protein
MNMVRTSQKVLNNKRKQWEIALHHKRKVMGIKKKIRNETKLQLKENQREFCIKSIENKLEIRKKFLTATRKAQAQQRIQQQKHRDKIREHKIKIMQIKRDR